MTVEEVKVYIALLSGLVGVAGFVYMLWRNRSQDNAGTIEALLTGWDNRVKDLVKANEECEKNREQMAGEIVSLKKTTEDKIKALEDEATRMRLESRRDLSSLYAENDSLRLRLRELEAGRGGR